MYETRTDWVLEGYRKDFERDGAVHAWRAYRWARANNTRLPGWLLEYLDGCAEAVVELADQAAESFQNETLAPGAEELLGPFGFRNGEGRSHAFARLRKREQHATFIHVLRLCLRRGDPKGEAVATAAQAARVSVDTGHRWARRFRPVTENPSRLSESTRDSD